MGQQQQCQASRPALTSYKSMSKKALEQRALYNEAHHQANQCTSLEIKHFTDELPWAARDCGTINIQALFVSL
jgi:hypothetical protein